MSTLPIRLPNAQPVVVPGFTRLVGVVRTILDVLTEAQDQARVLREKYPFAAE